MRFYYFSLFSWMAYGVAVVVAIVLLWMIWTKLLRLKLTNPVYWILVAAILVAPWGEELWISYNFDRLCRKDAGMFISKTVEADGYYNDTGVITRIVGGPTYNFIESPDGKGSFHRVEHATNEEKAHALAWYTEHHPTAKLRANEWIREPLSDREEVVVEQGTGYAWRITTLDKPTARYQYKVIDSHAHVSHEIDRFEDVVTDTQTGELLGRFVNYYRGPYWFFISLGAPTIPCQETEIAVRQHGTLALYALTLLPLKK